jgi:hypothetical protein
VKQSGVAVVALAALLEAGCLVQVTRVADAGPVFRAARSEARRLTGQSGPARELNVLVWDSDDRELVRVTMPMWLVRNVAHHSESWRCDRDGDGDDADEGFDCDHVGRIEGRIRGHVRLDDIERMGLGIVAEVEGDDGEQVLVWLR